LAVPRASSRRVCGSSAASALPDRRGVSQLTPAPLTPATQAGELGALAHAHGLEHAPVSARVRCPECGGLFRARGLAAHMRLKHAHEPLPALPANAVMHAPTEASAQALQLIHARLDGLAKTIESLAQRIAAPVASAPSTERSESVASPGPEELARLRAELDAVVASIKSTKLGSRAELARWGGAPRTSEEVAEQRAWHERLGQLRRQQFAILFRMGAHAPGASAALDLGDTGYY
jgi:hypothetical protein